MHQEWCRSWHILTPVEEKLRILQLSRKNNSSSQSRKNKSVEFCPNQTVTVSLCSRENVLLHTKSQCSWPSIYFKRLVWLLQNGFGGPLWVRNNWHDDQPYFKDLFLKFLQILKQYLQTCLRCQMFISQINSYTFVQKQKSEIASRHSNCNYSCLPKPEQPGICMRASCISGTAIRLVQPNPSLFQWPRRKMTSGSWPKWSNWRKRIQEILRSFI